MPEIFSKWQGQLKEFWSSLEKSQKMRIYITSAIVVITVAIGIFALTRPNHVTLIRDVEPKQIGEMSDILKKSNVWYSLGDDGRSIEVNSVDNNKAQVLLAQSGYPKGGMTFEDAISMIGISTTESDKKHIWHEQQVSDIEQKLMLLDNIELATVTLAIPEKNIFVSEGEKIEKPQANIMVKPTEPLTKEQVQGVIMIVARSVEGLDPSQITIVDNNSNILNSETEQDDVSIAGNQEEIRIKREKELQNKVKEYFNVGQFDSFDTLRVVANVSLDFDREKSQSKLLGNPDGMDGGALISSDATKEKLENGSTNGVPGTDTNPGTPNSPTYQTGTDGNSNYNKTHDVKNYEYNQVLKDTEKALGKMLPDQSSLAISLWYGRKVANDSGLNEDFINQVKLAASTATGIPQENISVTKYKLASITEEAVPLSKTIGDIVSKYGIFGLMILLIIGLLILAIPKNKKSTTIHTAMEEAATSRFAYPESSSEPVPEIQLEEKSEIKKQIDKFVTQKPDAVAQLLRNWLSDEWDA